MIIISLLLSLAYGFTWVGARLGSQKLTHLEKKLFPILTDSIEVVTPILSFNHEIVVVIFLSLSTLPRVMEATLGKILLFV